MNSAKVLIFSFNRGALLVNIPLIATKLHLALVASDNVKRSKLRAWARIFSMLLVLAWDLSRLLISNAILGIDEIRGFKYRRLYTGKAMRILGVDLAKEGEPLEWPVLYVSNHRSLLDPIIQLHFIDAYIVSKAEVGNYPLIGRGAKATGVVLVRRDNKESRAQSRDAIRELLLSGKSVLIYPEGTTSDAATTQEFKLGSFEIASEAGVPVVPVAIQYGESADHWADGPMLPFFIRKFGKKRIKACMFIGAPIASGHPVMAMESARQWIESKISDCKKETKASGG